MCPHPHEPQDPRDDADPTPSGQPDARIEPGTLGEPFDGYDEEPPPDITDHRQDDDVAADPDTGEPLTVSIDGDSVLVRGTSKDDAPVKAALLQQGFRWSGHLSAWFLPRSMRPETRQQRTRLLTQRLEALQRPVIVTDTSRTFDAGQRREAARQRADQRSHMLRRRSRDNRRRAASQRELSDRISEGYAGSPIQEGHHSQARHARDLERVRKAAWKAGDLDVTAADQERRAEQLRQRLTQDENPVTIKQRIERDTRQLARLQKALPKVGDLGIREDTITAIRTLREDIVLDNQILDTLVAKGVTRRWGPEDFRPGDEARRVNRWHQVVRVNRASVTVRVYRGPGQDYWDTPLQYTLVNGRRRDGKEILDGPVSDNHRPSTAIGTDGPDGTGHSRDGYEQGEQSGL